MSAESDNLVWESVLRGDDSAFAIIWDRHWKRVQRHLSRIAVTVADAEDLAALTFLEAWRRRRQVRFVGGSLLPWLLVTATNVNRNATRAKVRHARLLERAPRPDYAPNPADIHEARSIDPAIRDALATLSARDQALLLLVALEGVAIKDAASITGVKESTARMRLSRIRSRLQSNEALKALARGGLA